MLTRLTLLWACQLLGSSCHHYDSEDKLRALTITKSEQSFSWIIYLEKCPMSTTVSLLQLCPPNKFQVDIPSLWTTATNLIVILCCHLKPCGEKGATQCLYCSSAFSQLPWRSALIKKDIQLCKYTPLLPLLPPETSLPATWPKKAVCATSLYCIQQMGFKKSEGNW